MFLTLGRGGRPGTKIIPDAVVIHWTANRNKGADAIANRNYFENHPDDKVSAHYIVDDHQVVQCIPENEMAYHVGAKSYKPAALALLGKNPNAKTIGIEMCVNEDGNFHMTYNNTVKLTALILKKYGWKTNKLWRHYDITGKDCPVFFVVNGEAQKLGFANAGEAWGQFIKDVGENLSGRDKVITDYTNHWAEEAIKKVMDKGLMAKTDKFRPNDPLTRAEFATVLAKLIDRGVVK